MRTSVHRDRRFVPPGSSRLQRIVQIVAFVCLALGATVLGCGKSGRFQSSEAVKQRIQARLNASLEATRAKDIDRYMSFVPSDWTLHDDKGATLSRSDLRRGILEQWSIIDKTISIEERVERLTVQPDGASVWTSQRWERLMRERTGSQLDDVLTTQKHEEHWRFVRGQWWCYEVKELGGEIFVNGRPYHE